MVSARPLLSVLLALGLAGCGIVAKAPTAQPTNEQAFLAKQLSQLDALAVPQGVDAKVWDGLKSALAKSLSARLADGNPRQTLRAPVLDGAATHLIYDKDLGVFLWYYACPGDYDQNGEVNISDLTPLAVHLGQAVAATPDGAHSVQSVVDGDGNGLVTIADITPIGANLGKRVTAYNLYEYTAATPDAYPASNAAASTIAVRDSVAQSAGFGNPTTSRLGYFINFTPLLPGTYYWVRPVDTTDGFEGTPSSYIYSDNAYPTVALSALPIFGPPPLFVTLDASASTGTGLQFFWDPEGTGTFFGSGTDPSIAHEYDVVGNYTAFVRVENALGMSRTGTVALDIGAAPEWHDYAIPPPSVPLDTPKAVACGMDNGKPYILTAYHSSSFLSDNVSYYLAGGSTGSTWSDEVTIGSAFGDYQWELGTQTLDGVPAFVRTEDNYLDYNRADSSPLPSGWSNFHNAAIAGGNISRVSFRALGPYPAIAYYDAGVGEISFLLGDDSGGTTWFGPQTVAAVGGSNGDVGMTLLGSGLPAIAYGDTSSFGSLQYCDSTIPLFLVWAAPVQIESGFCNIGDSLLTLADGSPAVVLYQHGTQAIEFRRAPDSNGDDWSTSVTIAGSGDFGLRPEAIMCGGVPHAFWVDALDGRMYYCRATDASGTSWAVPEVAAFSVNSNVSCSPVDVNGVPGVGYVDGAGAFRFALKY